MTQKQQHTPGPWHVNGQWIDNYDSEPVCHLPPDATYKNRDANAAFIVRACNSHDALVEALENLLAANPAFRSMPIGSPGSVARIAQDMAIEAEDAAKVAIALAKGE